ncbi:MAG TPA: hypothetical protein VFX43_06880, partial [Chitinophagaceae bacterium]|nr:hypothetical protein [Chitinophagaceae bacterium]
ILMPLTLVMAATATAVCDDQGADLRPAYHRPFFHRSGAAISTVLSHTLVFMISGDHLVTMAGHPDDREAATQIFMESFVSMGTVLIFGYLFIRGPSKINQPIVIIGWRRTYPVSRMKSAVKSSRSI